MAYVLTILYVTLALVMVRSQEEGTGFSETSTIPPPPFDPSLLLGMVNDTQDILFGGGNLQQDLPMDQTTQTTTTSQEQTVTIATTIVAPVVTEKPGTAKSWFDNSVNAIFDVLSGKSSKGNKQVKDSALAKQAVQKEIVEPPVNILPKQDVPPIDQSHLTLITDAGPGAPPWDPTLFVGQLLTPTDVTVFVGGKVSIPQNDELHNQNHFQNEVHNQNIAQNKNILTKAERKRLRQERRKQAKLQKQGRNRQANPLPQERKRQAKLRRQQLRKEKQRKRQLRRQQQRLLKAAQRKTRQPNNRWRKQLKRRKRKARAGRIGRRKRLFPSFHVI